MKSKLIFFCSCYFTLAFMVTSVTATLSYGIGQIVMAKYLGYDASIHFNRVYWDRTSVEEELQDIYNAYPFEIDQQISFPGEDIYWDKKEKLNRDELYITLGGPLIILFIGLFGYLGLMFNKNRILSFGLRIIDWGMIFLSMFFLRYVFNLFVPRLINMPESSPYYLEENEVKLSGLLGLPAEGLSVVLGTIGILASLYVILTIIPEYLRLSFIFSSFLGGGLGLFLWMELLGPVLMP